MADYSDEMYDSWENQGTLNIPGASFAERRANEGFTGIILPTPDGVKQFAGKGYQMVPDMEPRMIDDPDTPGGKRIRNPKFGKPRRWPSDGDGKPGRIIQQTLIRLMVIEGIVSPDDFMSERVVEQFKSAAAGGTDDEKKFLEIVKKYGLRRLFVSGGSLRPEFTNAVSAVNKVPQVGATVGVYIDKLQKNEDNQGHTKIYRVSYEAPTAASLAKVDDYLRNVAGWLQDFLPSPTQTEEARHDDAAAGTTSSTAPSAPTPPVDDEPPF